MDQNNNSIRFKLGFGELIHLSRFIIRIAVCSADFLCLLKN